MLMSSPPPSRKKFMRLFGLLGLSLTAIFEVVWALISGLILELLASDVVPGLGFALNCFGLIAGIFIALAGYIVGTLIGFLIWSLVFARWKNLNPVP